MAAALKKAICQKTNLTKRGIKLKKEEKNEKISALDGDHFHDLAVNVVGAESHSDLK